MKKNEQKNSKKRLNSLILLVAFTAIMLIVSTYAWFTTQKNVSLSNLTGVVKVAEGLEISLDADSWSQEIDFSTISATELKQRYGASEHNVVPSELIPASTDGKEGIDAAEIPFYRGKATEVSKKWQLEIPAGTAGTGGAAPLAKDLGKLEGVGSTLTSSDNAFPGYYAIDLFLRNSGITDADTQGTTKEILQLSKGSKVTVLSTGGDATTGLQNTPRIAFALYNGSASVTANQEAILGAVTGGSATIQDVAIWEPNANAHVDTIVTNYNDMTWKDADASGYLAATATAGKAKYTATEIIPTYALTANSLGKTYADLYNWDGTTNAGLAKQIALQTNADATGLDYAKNLISVNTAETVIQTKNASGTATNFEMLKNTTLRLRMYVWLEGQDPDCVNYASHGGGIELNIGLCKGEPTSASGGS